ncbi:MAG: UvrD-helicase domain-containing protein [Actinobacteria bacterium]|nr:UvrD-helicase domain-containing protein [Actinomycetota bacterium]
MSAATALRDFDVCGPLPQAGVTVLEASAGTGKTFTIATLAARYVAEGIPLQHLLVVTFTRMATGELRDRVRERLVRAEQGLARVVAGAVPDAGDDLVCLLARGPQQEVALRHRRLADALSDFDAATIATTHEFCQHVLSSLGVAGDVDAGATFVQDVRPLVDEVVDDFYVRKFLTAGKPPFSRAEAGVIAHKAVANPDALLVPADAPADSDAALRFRLATAVRKEVDRRKRRAGLMTFDDLLTRLRDTLADPVVGDAACRRLRASYRVVLIDEFQDTDPIQWEIMRRAFGGGNATLVLIGDPKQAIYAFRGADVYAYLQAAQEADDVATLRVNWRSDQGLLEAYDALLGGTKLGHEGIAYRAVRAAEANREPRLVGAPVAAPLRVRMVPRDEPRVRGTKGGYLTVQSAREHIAADVAADVVRLLSSPAQIVRPSGRGGEREQTPVRPGDVAVLVHRHRDAALVRDALESVAVPAVINGAGSVFATTPAREWLRLLEALERPSAPTPVRGAALTSFLGWTAEEVAGAGEAALEELHAKLHRWAALLRGKGIASLLETVTLTEGLPERVLGREDGERELTDLRHVAQLLHAAAAHDHMGVTALTAWLRERIAESTKESDSEERSRRLDSDAEAVQVLTIFRSKGLEFPVVYCPFLWDPGWAPENEPPVFHDPEAADRRCIDVGGGDLGLAAHRQQHLREERGEKLRLAYVALTRAQHQAVLWWAPSKDSRNSPLCRLLFFRNADGNVAVAGTAAPPDTVALERLSELAADSKGRVSVERAAGADGAVWAGQQRAVGQLRAERFGRTLDARWRRTSYSAITSVAHEARVASEAEENVVTDEGPAPPAPAPTPAAVAPPEPDEEALRSTPSLLATMPGGVDIGTLVHRVLEEADFAAGDLDTDLVERIGHERSRRHVDVGDAAAVAAGLLAAIETPLGPLVGDLRLRDVGLADRIDELAFELPLVGGDAPAGVVSVQQLASLLRQHLPADDPLFGYADRLADPALAGELRGYLSGSVDLVLRAHGPGGTPRFAVVDYKTNVLATDRSHLSAWHYRPAALVEEMYRSHYPLQALLYTVAVHRYLRWRLPGYEAERNLAGVLYLFLRGMVGAATPRIGGNPCGVFAWMPPPSLVEALSDLFDRGGTAA